MFMDAFGGGESLKDILALGLEGNEPILDLNDKETLFKTGHRILELCNPGHKWIQEANFGTKALMERKSFLFPEIPFSSGDREARAFETIKRMKSQTLNIIMTQNPQGSIKFNTPTKGAAKDLYSSMVLAGWGVNKMDHELEEEEKPILYHGGLVTPRTAPVYEYTSPNTGKKFIRY
jgi:hypothetical protein